MVEALMPFKMNTEASTNVFPILLHSAISITTLGPTVSQMGPKLKSRVNTPMQVRLNLSNGAVNKAGPTEPTLVESSV
jgi:hypothetical protein